MVIQPGIEVFRIIAIIGVIIMHVHPFGESLIGDLLAQVARFSVPFFFIIAGFLFYNKIGTNKEIVFKYLIKYEWKLFRIYLLWYIIYAFWPLVDLHNWDNIAQNGLLNEFNKQLFLLLGEFKNHKLYYIGAGGRGAHLWFLPSLVL